MTKHREMTAKEIFELRNLGNTEKAYEAARQLYATDKMPYTRLVMFWTAVDMLRLHAHNGQLNEANRILLALERLQPNVPDKDGRTTDSIRKCRELLEREHTNHLHLQTESQDSHITEEAQHSLMGKWGEKVAADYLYRKGYEILEHDWHSGHRDIDIVAQQGEKTVFVEVKTRRNRDFGDPLEAIDYWKRYNLRRAITHYVAFYHIDHYRFDIITVIGTLNSTTPEITHLEDVSIQELESRHKKQRH